MTGPYAREQFASALYTEAWFLAALDRPDEALPILADMIARFEGDENPTINAGVKRARIIREEILDDESE